MWECVTKKIKTTLHKNEDDLTQNKDNLTQNTKTISPKDHEDNLIKKEINLTDI